MWNPVRPSTSLASPTPYTPDTPPTYTTAPSPYTSPSISSLIESPAEASDTPYTFSSRLNAPYWSRWACSPRRCSWSCPGRRLGRRSRVTFRNIGTFVVGLSRYGPWLYRWRFAGCGWCIGGEATIGRFSTGRRCLVRISDLAHKSSRSSRTAPGYCMTMTITPSICLILPLACHLWSYFSCPYDDFPYRSPLTTTNETHVRKNPPSCSNLWLCFTLHPFGQKTTVLIHGSWGTIWAWVCHCMFRPHRMFYVVYSIAFTIIILLPTRNRLQPIATCYCCCWPFLTIGFCTDWWVDGWIWLEGSWRFIDVSTLIAA